MAYKKLGQSDLHHGSKSTAEKSGRQLKAFSSQLSLTTHGVLVINFRKYSSKDWKS